MKADLKAFAADLDTKAFKVVHSPSLIFLCGGRLAVGSEAPPSLRHIFLEHVKQNMPDVNKRVLLAEVANEWYSVGQIFPNLLDLEEYIAGLSALILLFVESPGSIAELGAFSANRAFNRKLVAVIEDTHYAGRSFIRYGPIKLLQDLRDDSVHAFPWLKQGEAGVLDLTLCETAVEHVAEDMGPRLTELTGEQAFRVDDHGHRMLLIADFVSLAGALKEGELIAIFDALSIGIERDELKRYLFLLENLQILERKRYGNVTYLMPSSHDNLFLDISKTISGKHYDEPRLSTVLKESLPEDRDRQKVFGSRKGRQVRDV